MKQIFCLVFFCFFSKSIPAQSSDYKKGDTLNVFTLGGLKLREDYNLTSKVLQTMKLGDKVIVEEVLNEKKYLQIIEGYSGHWVRLKYDGIEGYAFDGFLSSLPIPKEDLLSVHQEKRNGGNETDIFYQTEKLLDAFDAYINQAFLPICDPVEYYNGSDGEGYSHLEIQKLSTGQTKISQNGWESYGKELLLPKTRLSELKNLIVLLAKRSGVGLSLFEQVKHGVNNYSEENRDYQEVLHLESLIIWIKHYPSDFDENKWSVGFTYIGS